LNSKHFFFSFRISNTFQHVNVGCVVIFTFIIQEYIWFLSRSLRWKVHARRTWLTRLHALKYEISLWRYEINLKTSIYYIYVQQWISEREKVLIGCRNMNSFFLERYLGKTYFISFLYQTSIYDQPYSLSLSAVAILNSL
jgi:hypothetical protein